ncbi:MAG TPA: hypothetical protein VGT05_00235 [Patescibacteria group bacterium]|nr:hypothetical protein [Patescibacteria group bacterium]
MVQQDIRQSANDPQIQMAEDDARQLSNGQAPKTVVSNNTVDISQSLRPYTIVYDDKGNIIASSARLHGQMPQLPPEIFPDTKRLQEQHFTWQPKEGVRQAVVIDYFSAKTSGFVLAGRSIREVEKREDQIGLIAIIGWISGTVITGVITLLITMLLTQKKK